MPARPSTDARVQPEFNLELDGVRGVAMVGIFLFHCAPKTGSVFIDGFTGSLWSAIDVFFALSGFLITRNLLDDQENGHRFRNFYLNRALRIVPAYLLALFLVFVVLSTNAAVAKALDGVPDAWWFLTYTFNFQVAFANAWPDNFLLNHFWSLCVEEQFYLLWPLFVYLAPRRWWLHLVATMFAIAFVAEIWLLLRDAHWSVIHTSLFTRLDSVGIGALAAFLHRSPYRWSIVPWCLRLFWLCSAVLLFCALMKRGLWPTGWHSHLIVQPALMLWSATLIYLLVNPPKDALRGAARFLRVRLFTVLGKYSYGVYIYHWIIHMLVVEIDAFGWKTPSPWTNFGIVAAWTVVMAFLSYQLVEKHFLRLKTRTFRPLASASDTRPIR